MKEKYIFLKVCLSRNFIILDIIPIDFDILFFMYVICADQFSLLSMIMPRNLVMLLRSMRVLLIYIVML